MQANLVEVEGDKVLQLVSQQVSQLVDQAGVEVEAIEWAHKITQLLLVKLCNNQKYMIL
jgi:acetolactate synthase regulatory subunit